MKSISIQNTSRCNLKCTVCPHSILWKNNQKDMTLDVWNSILDNLNKYNISPDIILDIMGEPLLDKTFKAKITSFNEKMTSKLTIVTNGTMLDQDMILFCKEHRVNVAISVLGGSPSKYKEITGLDFKMVIGKILKCINMELMVSATITAFEPATELVEFLDSLNIKYNVHEPYLMTRPQNIITIPKSKCETLYTTAYVNVIGDMFMCCSDWEFKTKIGNVADGIYDIWSGEYMQKIRLNMNNNIYPAFCIDHNTFCMMD